MIILEGCNGVGKTTYAKMLSHILDAPVYRAFRNGERYDGDLERARSLGIPVNTYVDDMYMADISRVISNEVILDRSLMSAVAYDGGMSLIWEKRLADWSERLKQSFRPAFVVRLVASYDVARSRMGGHVPSLDEYRRLELMFSWCASRVDIPVAVVNTSNRSVIDGLRAIWEKRHEICQASKNSEVG